MPTIDGPRPITDKQAATLVGLVSSYALTELGAAASHVAKEACYACPRVTVTLAGAYATLPLLRKWGLASKTDSRNGSWRPTRKGIIAVRTWCRKGEVFVRVRARASIDNITLGSKE